MPQDVPIEHVLFAVNRVIDFGFVIDIFINSVLQFYGRTRAADLQICLSPALLVSHLRSACALLSPCSAHVP